VAQHAVGRCAAADRFEDFVRERVIGGGKPHSVSRHKGQFHPLRDGDQTAIHQLFGGVTVEGELEIEPARVQLHQATSKFVCLHGFGGITGMLDCRGQHAPVAGMRVSAITRSL
jgi:hypothetical protein